MTRIAEIVSPETLKVLYPEAATALDLANEYRIASGKTVESGLWTFPLGTPEADIGIPFVRYVWSLMWSNSAKLSPELPPFVRVFDGSIASLLRKQFDKPWNDTQMYACVGQVSVILRSNKLVRHMSAGSKKWLLAPWHDIVMSRGTKQRPRDEVIVTEQRIAEEANKPVEHKFDIAAIPLPGPNADEVLAYVEKIADAYKSMARAFERDEAALIELEAENTKLKADIEKLTIAGQDWRAVVERIREKVQS